MGNLAKYFWKLVVSALVTFGVVTFIFADGVNFSNDTQATDSPTVTVDSLEDGVYEGVGQGFGGDVAVEVTVEGGAITNVEVVEHGETEGISDPALEQIPEEIVEKNGTDVAVVSGASSTSNGIIEAVNNALGTGGGTEGVAANPADMEDGTYTATVDGHNGPLTVDVTIEAGAITDVTVVEHEESTGIADPALEDVPAAIVEANGTDVDTVSGATVTSEAIIQAVNAALVVDTADSGAGVVVTESAAEESDASGESTEGSEESDATDASEATGAVTTTDTTYEDGTHTATVDGHNGELTVEVTVEDGVITAVDVTEHEESEGIADPALEEVPAAIVEANGTDVDTVSGATVTSEAIIAAVNEALGADAAAVVATEDEADEESDSEESASDEASEESESEESASAEEDSDGSTSSEDDEDKADETELKDGEYTGTAKGHNGDLTVEVKVKDGKITDVEVTEHEESEGIVDPALEDVPAAIVEANGTDVDTVSGATVTSEAIIEAVEEALKTIETSDDEAEYEDGKFEATVDGHNGPLTVEVLVEDGKITAIKLIAQEETEGIADAALEDVPKEIIKANSTDIEIVSGATVTSEAIIEAVEKALKK